MTGADLRRRREKAGLTRTQLAAAVEASERTVYRWEAGEVAINLRNETALLAVLKKRSSKPVADPREQPV